MLSYMFNMAIRQHIVVITIKILSGGYTNQMIFRNIMYYILPPGRVADMILSLEKLKK